MESLEDIEAYWRDKGEQLVKRARAGALDDIELACDVSAWPDSWIAAELLTHDRGTEHELAAGSVLDQPHALRASPAGDVVAALGRAEATSGRERIDALEAAWRACFAPELADLIEALDAALDTPAMPVAKKKKDTEALWAVAAETAPARSVFAGEWPKQWRDAQRRMRPLYARPRSPLFAAAALDFTRRDPRPYTSLASQVYWQAHAWFIAEQGDVRQLAALEAFERSVAKFVGHDRTRATDALRAFRPRELPAKAREMIERLAKTTAPRATPATLSLASAEERAVAADQLLQAGDPRGEFITVQTQLANTPTPALVKRQAQLLKKHAKTWVPGTIYRDTCVFRGGVPIAGHLMFRSDPELAAMAGSQALATFETLVIDGSFAMGEISPSTIAEVVASLPALRFVITTDEAATAIARGAPTAIERIAVEGDRVMLDGPGLPKLRHLDAPVLDTRWRDRPWFARLAAIGCKSPDNWDRWRTAGLGAAIVLTDAAELLHRRTARVPNDWELWAEGKTVTARHQVGSTAASLVRTLGRVRSWKDIATLRVPKNFVEAVAPFATENKLTVKAIAAVEPIRDGISLDLA